MTKVDNPPEESSNSSISIHEAREEDLYNEKPDISKAAVKKYLATRITTLFDIPIRKTESTVWQVLNPIPGLKLMNSSNWNFYLLGFLAWTVDSMDFFCVSASAPEIAHTLQVDITEITWGVTLVLMLRSVGAFIFGIMSDYFGRKYPYIFICGLFVVLEIGTGFVQTYPQFLAVRALFGIAMGAMYGVASCTALEDQPPKARSILSGLFLPGYNLGYLLAVVFFRAFGDTYKGDQGWRALFWFSAGLPLILIVWRLWFPESKTFINMKKEKKVLAAKSGVVDSWFDRSILTTMKTEWLMFVYLVFLMSGFNFMSHGSQDLFITLLVKQHGIGPDAKTVIMVVVNLGAICGGLFFGQLTELLGRRLTIIICCIFSGAFLYPSFFSSNVSGIIGGYFFLNFGVMGAWGVAPVHLLELVNTTHRTFLSGLTYQLGNLASSASSTIEAEIGTRFPVKLGGATDAYDYGKVMAIFCGAVFAYMIVFIFLGPERFHKTLTVHDIDDDRIQDSDHFSLASDTKASVEHKSNV
ncbi:hypothetical protein PGUG_03440 [Meyerozyma guilliermondii ATCC 6260]|uniref:Major facilitator superfamily (MFS) profile domain-containing protein n=1 Tax=Meyerozyma guilliermondii (strain ATCC 6260 / CBS 566 / DSM 6381 / JCM 1539 / NBRC 10279 / NRRL Y-324) TaxID=294746 RepID=A5DJI9_PICGU|nr:uncharacterized protein PGUG_03440 [Meyerozyma guilliermondii ATCC 6260]EDK39342.2 hypothetical protein PGUG_03440 [Meyerozyma guilliermondii ATCC 6260]